MRKILKYLIMLVMLGLVSRAYAKRIETEEIEFTAPTNTFSGAVIMDGNVGIGTAANPAALVNISKSVAQAVTNELLRLTGPYQNNAGSRISWWGGTSLEMARLDAVISPSDLGVKMTLSTSDAGGTRTDRMVIDKSGNIGIGISTNTTYKLQVIGTGYFSGKLKVVGGVDPPYNHLWEQSLADVTNRVAVEVPPSMYKGVVQAYIEDMDALFFWQPSSGHWIRLAMATGAITKGAIDPWLTNKAPFEWADSYMLDAATGQLIRDQIPINDKKWILKVGYSLDEATGVFYDAGTNVVTKSQAIEYVAELQ